MPIFNKAQFFERSRGNVLIFIVNPFWNDFGGQKTLTKKEQGGHGNFSGFPQVVDAPF
jgi:hypothetical protein